MVNTLIIPLYKAIVRPQLDLFIQAWRPYHKKDIDTLERVQQRAAKRIPELKYLCFERRLLECRLTTLESRILREDVIDVFKILNGYEGIDSNISFKLKQASMTRGHMAAIVKPYCM